MDQYGMNVFYNENHVVSGGHDDLNHLVKIGVKGILARLEETCHKYDSGRVQVYILPAGPMVKDIYIDRETSSLYLSQFQGEE